MGAKEATQGNVLVVTMSMVMVMVMVMAQDDVTAVGKWGQVLVILQYSLIAVKVPVQFSTNLLVHSCLSVLVSF